MSVLAGDRVVVYTGMGDHETGTVFSVGQGGYVIDVDGFDGAAGYRQYFNASTDVRRVADVKRHR